MVKRLERLVVDEQENDVDRLCAGFFLLCIYLRARYSDGQGLKGLMIDEPDCFMGPLAGYFSGCGFSHEDQLFSGKEDGPAAYGWAPVRGCCCAVV